MSELPEHELEQAGLSVLVDYIEQTHHVFTRAQLGLVAQLLAGLDAASSVRLPDIRKCFAALQADLQQHLLKEEHILFPCIRGMELNAAPPDACFGSVANPIRVMRMEHETVGKLLHELRALTDGYHAAGGDVRYRELCAALSALDADLVRHIRLEDDILFPRVLRLEGGETG